MFDPKVIQLLQADLGRDCLAFLPELILGGGIVPLLLLRLARAFDRLHLGWVALVIAGAAVVAAWGQWQGDFGLKAPRDYGGSLDIFTGLLVYDNFTVYLRLFLLFFAALIVWLTLL